MTEHEVPEPIRRAVEQEERTAAALERATAPLEVEPAAPQSSAEAFTVRMAAQRRAEDEREARTRRLMFEHAGDPDVALDEPDPLREFARAQRAARKRRRRG